jgi:multiple sugar transport system permease protein
MHVVWWVPFLFLAPALIGLFVFRVVPIGIALAGGFFGTSLMGETLFKGFANYESLFADPSFWGGVKVTVAFNLIINPLQVVLAFLLALLTFRPTRFVVTFRTIYFLPITTSIALTAVLWNIMLDPSVGPVNGLLRALGVPAQPFFRGEGQALPTLIAVASWRGVGYWMFFMLAGLAAIPRDVYEAAALDGARAWQRMRYITLPMMKRTLVFVLVADTAVNFLFFAPVYIITNGGPNGATSLLMFQAYQAAFALLDHGRSLAISTIILVIIAIFALSEFRLMRAKEAE